MRNLKTLAVAAGTALACSCGTVGLAASADFVSASSIGSFFIIDLPAHKWCRNRSGPMVVVSSATQIQEWCDPGNRDLLQADIFVKTGSGDAGNYDTSHKDWPCSAPLSDRVRERLC